MSGEELIKMLNLGQIAGIVVGSTEPSRKNVIWANEVTAGSNNWILKIWNGSAWVTLNSRFVGEIIYTGLTIAQAQSQLGADGVNWISANGQSCAGTAYETLSGNSVVPDLSPIAGQAILIKVN